LTGDFPDHSFVTYRRADYLTTAIPRRQAHSRAFFTMLRTTSRTLSALPLGIVLALALLLSGCGSSDSVTHIAGSSATISKPMLDHWMRAVVGTDFRVSTGAKGPPGLASEPADYGGCVAASKKVVARTPTGKLKLTDGQIMQKCHELYRAIRNQAMSYLLSAEWTMLEAKELHVSLSDAELHKEFLRWRAATYKTDAKFQAYMKERQLVLSDVLYQLKRNILVTRLLPTFQAQVKRAGGGERVYAKLALERYHNLIAKTSCKAGYVMEDCKEYRAPATPLPSSNVIIEGIVQGNSDV
jgi:hypothetical protein